MTITSLSFSKASFALPSAFVKACICSVKRMTMNAMSSIFTWCQKYVATYYSFISLNAPFSSACTAISAWRAVFTKSDQGIGKCKRVAAFAMRLLCFRTALTVDRMRNWFKMSGIATCGVLADMVKFKSLWHGTIENCVHKNMKGNRPTVYARCAVAEFILSAACPYPTVLIIDGNL